MFNKEKQETAKDKRFIVKSTEHVSDVGQYTILVDRITGVHYLQIGVEDGSSITPLLDGQGRVVIEHGPIN